MNRLPLKGIVPPLVTPLKDKNHLDVEGLERLIEHVLAGGVHGLFVLGTTGEAPSLGYELRYELVERAARQVDGRVPVLVGITDTSFAESIKLARHAHAHGADAVVVAPPFYFKPSQSELLEYFEHIAAESPLPIYLYNMPGCTHVDIDPKTVLKMSSNPKVLGYKDSSYNMVHFHKVRLLLKDRPDFSMFVGPCELMAEAVLMGGSGGVNGGANMFPKLYVDLYNAAIRKDTETIMRLQRKVVQVCSAVYCMDQSASSTIKGIKCALNLMGICSDEVSLPFSKFPEKQRRVMEEILIRLDLSQSQGSLIHEIHQEESESILASAL